MSWIDACQGHVSLICLLLPRCLVGKLMHVSYLFSIWVCQSAINVGAMHLKLVRLRACSSIGAKVPTRP